MGEMASEIAHEVNQPLTAIVNYTRGVTTRLRNREISLDELYDVMEKISVQALRAGDLIRRIRSFVRKSELASEPCDLNELVRNAVTLLTAGGRRAARIRLLLDDALPKVRGDAIQLEQVILNLVGNAIDAVAADPEQPVTIQTERIDGRELRLAVTDNGCGLPDADTERVFEPFYTTKAGGLGLGLPISRTIVEAHGGRIWAEASESHGATFVVAFPVGNRAD